MHPARFPQQKPYRGARINWAHPCARDLLFAWVFNEQTGWPHDLVSMAAPVQIIGSPVWVPDGMNFPGSAGLTFTDESMIAKANKVSGLASSYTILYEVDYQTTGQAYDTQIAFNLYDPQWISFIEGSGDLALTCYPTNYGGTTQFRSGVGLNNPVKTCITRRIGADAQIYTSVNNIFELTFSGTHNLNIPTVGDYVRLAYSGSTSESHRGDMYYLYMWNRYMLEAEAEYLFANPYAFLMN